MQQITWCISTTECGFFGLYLWYQETICGLWFGWNTLQLVYLFYVRADRLLCTYTDRLRLVNCSHIQASGHTIATRASQHIQSHSISQDAAQASWPYPKAWHTSPSTPELVYCTWRSETRLHNRPSGDATGEFLINVINFSFKNVTYCRESTEKQGNFFPFLERE